MRFQVAVILEPIINYKIAFHDMQCLPTAGFFRWLSSGRFLWTKSKVHSASAQPDWGSAPMAYICPSSQLLEVFQVLCSIKILFLICRRLDLRTVSPLASE